MPPQRNIPPGASPTLPGVYATALESTTDDGAITTRVRYAYDHAGWLRLTARRKQAMPGPAVRREREEPPARPPGCCVCEYSGLTKVERAWILAVDDALGFEDFRASRVRNTIDALKKAQRHGAEHTDSRCWHSELTRTTQPSRILDGRVALMTPAYDRLPADDPRCAESRRQVAQQRSRVAGNVRMPHRREEVRRAGKPGNLHKFREIEADARREYDEWNAGRKKKAPAKVPRPKTIRSATRIRVGHEPDTPTLPAGTIAA